MADERKAKLDDLIKRRDRLKEMADRLRGRLESARLDLAAVEDDCRKRGIPPEKLDMTIVELGKRFDTAANDLADRVEAAEEALKPFTEILAK